MSYVYDIQRRIWSQHIRPLVVREHGEVFSFYFEDLMEEMHSANHSCDLQDSPSKGDGVNKHPRVCQTARELEEFVKNLPAKPDLKARISAVFGKFDEIGGLDSSWYLKLQQELKKTIFDS
jgi:hypothetical protein